MSFLLHFDTDLIAHQGKTLLDSMHQDPTQFCQKIICRKHKNTEHLANIVPVQLVRTYVEETGNCDQ